MGKYGRVREATVDNIIRRMRFACRITKATNTHSEYVTFIAFPLQQWFETCASTTAIVCFHLTQFCKKKKKRVVHPLEQFLETRPKENVFRRFGE